MLTCSVLSACEIRRLTGNPAFSLIAVVCRVKNSITWFLAVSSVKLNSFASDRIISSTSEWLFFSTFMNSFTWSISWKLSTRLNLNFAPSGEFASSDSTTNKLVKQLRYIFKSNSDGFFMDILDM